MAKKKKGRKRQGLVSKLINVGGILIGLARPIQILIGSGFTAQSLDRIVKEATFGLAGEGFNLDAGLKFYAPVGAAVGYRELTKYLMRHFPVR